MEARMPKASRAAPGGRFATPYRGAALFGLCAILMPAGLHPVSAQEIVPLGPGEPSGSRSSVLPPPSGSQNPVLPPPSGYRYAPGTEGRWGDAPQRLPTPATPPRSGALPPPATRDLQGVVRPSREGAGPVQINSVSAIGAGIGHCWQPPQDVAGRAEAGFTLRFSLRRNGTVIASPRLVAGPGGADAEADRRLVESALEAMRKCAPLPLSPGLGASIAGRPISLRFEPGS
jgi:hypothetical protein